MKNKEVMQTRLFAKFRKKMKGAVSNLTGIFLGLFISLIVISALWTTLTGQLATIQNDNNSTDAVKNLWGIVPLLIVVIIVAAIAYIIIRRS